MALDNYFHGQNYDIIDNNFYDEIKYNIFCDNDKILYINELFEYDL